MSFSGINRLGPYDREYIHHTFVKKFAFIPRRCKDGRIVWLGNYYNKYLVFSYAAGPDISYLQYSLTEGDAIIEKLIETP